jgi:hypothetical protein
MFFPMANLPQTEGHGPSSGGFLPKNTNSTIGRAVPAGFKKNPLVFSKKNFFFMHVEACDYQSDIIFTKGYDSMEEKRLGRMAQYRGWVMLGGEKAIGINKSRQV